MLGSATVLSQSRRTGPQNCCPGLGEHKASGPWSRPELSLLPPVSQPESWRPGPEAQPECTDSDRAQSQSAGRPESELLNLNLKWACRAIQLNLNGQGLVTRARGWSKLGSALCPRPGLMHTVFSVGSFWRPRTRQPRHTKRARCTQSPAVTQHGAAATRTAALESRRRPVGGLRQPGPGQWWQESCTQRSGPS